MVRDGHTQAHTQHALCPVLNRVLTEMQEFRQGNVFRMLTVQTEARNINPAPKNVLEVKILAGVMYCSLGEGFTHGAKAFYGFFCFTC